MKWTDLRVVQAEWIAGSSPSDVMRCLSYAMDSMGRSVPIGSGIVCLFEAAGVHVLVVEKEKSK